MAIEYKSYSTDYESQLVALFEEFQYYLVHIDPLKRLRLLPGFGKKVLEQNIEEVKKNEGLFLIALEGDQVIGFSVGIIEKLNDLDLLSTYPTTVGRINELYVEALHRGSGVGGKLMKKMEEYFKTKGCDCAKVEVFAPNDPAKGLYAKLGYEQRTIDNIKKLS